MAQSEMGTLKVTVNSIEKGSGKIFLAVYKDSDTFLSEDFVIRESKEVSKASSQVISIPLEYGEYGISLYHDENDNGELDRNFFRFPTEPYGFSNDAKAELGPPSFEDSKFLFNEGQSEINISLR